MNERIEFIEQAGGCVVSRNILLHKGKLRWCVREESINSVDNGWRFLSDIDTDEYLSDPNNMTICDFNTVASIEPAILALYDYPVGTDVELVDDGKKKKFIDCKTGEEMCVS